MCLCIYNKAAFAKGKVAYGKCRNVVIFHRPLSPFLLVDYYNKIHKAGNIKIHENMKLKKTVFSSNQPLLGSVICY